MSRRVAGALAASVLLVCASAGTLAVARSSDASDSDGQRLEVAGEAAALPEPLSPAFAVGPPRRSTALSTARWAPVLAAVPARAAPSSGAAIVGNLDATTPEGTTNIVLVLRSRAQGNRIWVRVRLPLLADDPTGWVPREALGGYASVRTHLVVDLSRLTATLLRDRRTIFTAPVGVGTPSAPTPVGRFYVRNKLTRFASPAYGPLAFGTSARSRVLTDWPAGGYIGIHGTDQPKLLPGRVSHGCIRLRNEDILRLAQLMPVGTPITIRA